MVDDGFDGQMNVGLIQIGRIAGVKTLPFTRIHLVFRMNPNFGSIEPVERRFVQQIFFNHCVFVVIV
jgi:hypothetical protein